MKLLHILGISWVLAVASAAAQGPQAPQLPVVPEAPITPALDLRNAHETRQLLQNLFQQYPPSLSQVLRLDPSLLTNQGYMSPYPNLAAFLAQHPEIAHNPGFFIGAGDAYRDYSYGSPEDRAAREWEQAIVGIGVFTAGLIGLSVVCWVIKTVIDHRRWLRISKVQSEVHSKLLDRLTSNQELLAYLQTPAGMRFLEFAPISMDTPSSGLSAPVSRIFFSVQAGIVLALAGLGLLFVSQWLTLQEVAQPLFVVAILALALGVGFVISAAVAYLMSRHLGLLNHARLASAGDGAGVSPPHA
jgi:hypothetical protein